MWHRPRPGPCQAWIQMPGSDGHGHIFCTIYEGLIPWVSWDFSLGCILCVRSYWNPLSMNWQDNKVFQNLMCFVTTISTKLLDSKKKNHKNRWRTWMCMDNKAFQMSTLTMINTKVPNIKTSEEQIENMNWQAFQMCTITVTTKVSDIKRF